MSTVLVGLAVVLIVLSILPFLIKGSELDSPGRERDVRIRAVLLVMSFLIGVALLYEGLHPGVSFDPSLLPVPDMLG